MGDAEDDLPFHDGDPPESEKGEHEKKGLYERAIPELLKRVLERAVDAGANRLADGPENLRNFVQELKLPKEVLHYLYTQIDDTKNGLYRVVAKEIRDVLEHTQFADELTKTLTRLSFEIKTEIRFVPNEKASHGPGKSKEPGAEKEGEEEGEGDRTKLPKPEVTSQVSMKDHRKDARR